MTWATALDHMERASDEVILASKRMDPSNPNFEFVEHALMMLSECIQDIADLMADPAEAER